MQTCIVLLTSICPDLMSVLSVCVRLCEMLPVTEGSGRLSTLINVDCTDVDLSPVMMVFMEEMKTELRSRPKRRFGALAEGVSVRQHRVVKFDVRSFDLYTRTVCCFRWMCFSLWAGGQDHTPCSLKKSWKRWGGGDSKMLTEVRSEHDATPFERCVPLLIICPRYVHIRSLTRCVVVVCRGVCPPEIQTRTQIAARDPVSLWHEVFHRLFHVGLAIVFSLGW